MLKLSGIFQVNSWESLYWWGEVDIIKSCLPLIDGQVNEPLAYRLHGDQAVYSFKQSYWSAEFDYSDVSTTILSVVIRPKLMRLMRLKLLMFQSYNSSSYFLLTFVW